MIISKRIVQKSKKKWLCSSLLCNDPLIPKGSSYVRLYGAAHNDEPKYVVRLHLECGKDVQRG